MKLFRKYEIVLGLLLATAFWAIISAFAQGNSHPNANSEQIGAKQSDEIIAEYTELLAWFTGVLALVSIAQGYFLYRADETARLNATAAKEAADAATINSNLALATERPYVFIDYMSGRTFVPAADMRDISNKYRRNVDYRDLQNAIDKKCTIKNYGKNLALIRQISAQFRLSKDPSPITLSPLTAIPPVLAGGGAYTFEVPMAAKIDDNEISRMIQEGQQHLWLHFSFVYRDIFGNEHVTAGRWQYSFAGDNWKGDYERAT
jgi:hypothetical protein